MSYFGVYMPPTEAGFKGTITQCAGSIAAEDAEKDLQNPPDSPLWLIFTNKSKALDMLRRYKEARLREFPNRDQAECYVQFGFESIESLKRYGNAKPASKPIQMPSAAKTASSGTVDRDYSSSSSASSPTSHNSNSSSSLSHVWSGHSVVNGAATTGSNQNNIGNSNSGSSRSTLNAERPPFRAPTKQELVEFRKQIEAGNYERVKNVVWENPRFLISSGDTPTSLKEGCRYNAMHIAAQYNQARVAELLLKIISDIEFTQLYAGKKSNGQMCAALNENLLDYYLNMPDKVRGETPLHFAVKTGHVAIVEVLISYPQCKLLKNFEGKYPKDIICQRLPNASPDLMRKLELLLSEPYFVPVLRDCNNVLPPQIGQPFTPTDPPILQDKTEECEHLNVDLRVSALAGPMTREQAESFFRRWKTPPRLGSNIVSPLANSPLISPMKTPNKSMFHRNAIRSIPFSLTSPKKSSSSSIDESNGNHQPQPQQQQQQQSPLLHNGHDTDSIERNNNYSNNNFTEEEQPTSASIRLWMPSTPIRQMKPDLFLNYRNNDLNCSMEDSPDKIFDLSLNVSNVSVSDLNDSFRERHIKNSDIEKGLEVVGRQLARQKQHEWREYWDFLNAFLEISTPNGLTHLENYLSELQMQMLEEKSLSTAITATTQMMTPYTCVEKSLQVFAKRITKTLINNIANIVSINDTLLSELRRLKSLIVSFKDDARFTTVDFAKVHSRIAHLVASYIAQNHTQDSVGRTYGGQVSQLTVLRKLLDLNGDRREHLYCVCASMVALLELQEPVVQLPETEELCLAAWQAEKTCGCLWDASLSRKTSRRKRAESRRSADQMLSEAAAALHIYTPAPLPVTTSPMDEAVEEDNDDIVFYECTENIESSDDDEVYFTPPQSRSPSISCDLPNRYELFIYGKEPTKRDVDVLFAIHDAHIDKDNLPHVHAWLTAMRNFSADDMELFPSPRVVKQTNKPLAYPGARCNGNSSSIGGGSDRLLSMQPKKLFAPTKTVTSPRSQFAVPASPPKPTRLSEKRSSLILGKHDTSKKSDLFTRWREPRQDLSPMPASPTYVRTNSFSSD